MSVIKLIDLKEDETVFYGKKHLIQVALTPPNQELLYDGKKVSSVEFQGRTRHAFMIEESGKQNLYEVIVTYRSGVSGSSVAKTTSKVLLSLVDRNKIRAINRIGSVNPTAKTVCNAAVVRNGEIVCNDGINFSPTPLEDLKKELMPKPKN